MHVCVYLPYGCGIVHLRVAWCLRSIERSDEVGVIVWYELLLLLLCCVQADQLLRETHPVPLLSKDGQMLDAVFFEQFRSMLIDANT